MEYTRTVNFTEGEEIQLGGGLANAGKVVRVGNTVRRPLKPSTPAIDRFLRYIREQGFEGAPEPLGRDSTGRSVYSFVEGEVDQDTNPAWARDDDLLTSVAVLQHGLHDASRGFVPLATDDWDMTLPWPGDKPSLVCHNDFCISNIVARDGRAIAVIDFDFLAPSHPLWDVAIALRHWLPIKDPVDLVGTDLDIPGRFARYCDAYGTAERSTVVTMVGDFLDQAFDSMKRRYEQGIPAYVAVWEAGYPAQNRRSRDWIDANAHALRNARC